MALSLKILNHYLGSLLNDTLYDSCAEILFAIDENDVNKRKEYYNNCVSKSTSLLQAFLPENLEKSKLDESRNAQFKMLI